MTAPLAETQTRSLRVLDISLKCEGLHCVMCSFSFAEEREQ